MLIKYKVSDVARDFGMQNKEIINLLSKYDKAPKSASQALSEQELDIVFDCLSQENQIKSLQDVFAPAAEAAEQRKKEAEEQLKQQALEQEQQKLKAQQAQEAAKSPQSPQKQEGKPQQKAQSPQGGQKVQSPQSGQAAQGEQKPVVLSDAPKESGPKVHYVDTRGSNVNIEKYDERLDTLVPEKAGKLAASSTQKQKLVKQQRRGPFVSNKKRQEEQDKMRQLRQQTMAKKVPLKVLIPDEIAVGELALRLKKTAVDVIKQLMKLGVMASVSQVVDFDTAALVSEEFGAVVEREVIMTIEDKLLDESADQEKDLISRAPVVVVMGHVDHGKTSLLDAIRETKVASGEAGGITQHIGAYRVSINDQEITFLDTPGHAAFTSMRSRGAQVTDIAILVVAADDGIMPQTIEAINHARAFEVPIVVAVNKVDKPGANVDKIMQQLTEYNLVPEEWGGSTIVCPVSAKERTGIDNLLEMVLLTAEILELKANPNRLAKGTVIEARLDKGRGPIASVLIQNGTLNAGDIVIAGKAVGRVRVMTDDRGQKVQKAGPSVPVEIVGLAEVPEAGDIFHAVEDERMARELAQQRKDEEKASLHQKSEKITLENLFAHIGAGNVKDLNIIVKADVQGSAEAVRSSLEKLSNEEVRVRVIHQGVGGVSDSDVMLASATNAIIVGFNVRPDSAAIQSAQNDNVQIKLYRIIYDCIEEIEQAMKGMLAPKFREAVLGHAEVRQTFKASSVGTIAGCHVIDGKIVRSEQVRLVRGGIVVYEGELGSLKRFKDDAKEVVQGFDCGISLDRFNDIKEGDVFESFMMEEIKQ